VDVSESPIERPQKKQRRHYSGKKKRHTLKTQIIVDKNSKKIICVCFSAGKNHDYKLFKESNVYLPNTIKIQADSGYQGLQYRHRNTEIPIKKVKIFR
jgi:hypothetical protein